MAVLGLQVAGATQFKAELGAILKRVKNFKPMARPIDWVLRKNVERHFRGEGTHKGAWRALSKATQIDRARQGYPPKHPMLVRSGELKRSLISRGHPRHILDATRRFIEFGSKTGFSSYHQTGTPNMPAREMILADAADLNEIIQLFRRYVMDNSIFLGV